MGNSHHEIFSGYRNHTGSDTAGTACREPAAAAVFSPLRRSIFCRGVSETQRHDQCICCRNSAGCALCPADHSAAAAAAADRAGGGTGCQTLPPSTAAGSTGCRSCVRRRRGIGNVSAQQDLRDGISRTGSVQHGDISKFYRSSFYVDFYFICRFSGFQKQSASFFSSVQHKETRP